MARNALEGLGQGLQQFGQMYYENYKTDLANKLAIEKEERDAARQLAREERQKQEKLQSVDSVDYVEIDGRLMKRYKNNEDTVLRTEPADQTAIERYKREEEKEKLALEKDRLEVQRAERQNRMGAIEEQYAVPEKEAEIAARNRQYNYTGRRDSGIDSSFSGQEPTPSEAAQDLSNMFPDLRKQYTSAAKGEQPVMTAAEWERLAYDVVKQAAKRGQWKEAPAIFRDAIERYTKLRPASAE